jgi:hypothetical protein
MIRMPAEIPCWRIDEEVDFVVCGINTLLIYRVGAAGTVVYWPQNISDMIPA